MKFYNFLAVFFKILFKIFFRVELRNWDKIPVGKDAIVCANHHSYWDPVFISTYYPEHIYWMGKKELFDHKILKIILETLGVFPVDRKKIDMVAMRTALGHLKNDEKLGIFPEGTRVKSPEDSDPKAGVGLIAVKMKTVVVPIRIESDFRIFSKVVLTVKEPYNFREGLPKPVDYEKVSKDIMERIYS